MYDHRDKAGNRADVWKHFVLLSVVRGLVEGRAFLGDPIDYVESHAGGGRYAAVEGAAWEEGAGRLLAAGGPDLAAMPERLRTHPYLRLLHTAMHPECGRAEYHGSWYLVGEFLDSEVVPYTMALCETSDEAGSQLNTVLCADLEAGRLWPGVTVHDGSDGYAVAAAHQEAALVFIDPPYAPRGQGDWNEVTYTARLLAEAGTGVLIWYPITADPETEARLAALYSAAGSGARGAELRWTEAGEPGTLTGCGMLAAGSAAQVFAEQLNDDTQGALALLAERLGGRVRLVAPFAD